MLSQSEEEFDGQYIGQDLDQNLAGWTVKSSLHIAALMY